MPGEITLKFIYMPIEGIENDLLRVIWQLVLTIPKVGRVIPVLWLI